MCVCRNSEGLPRVKQPQFEVWVWPGTRCGLWHERPSPVWSTLRCSIATGDANLCAGPSPSRLRFVDIRAELPSSVGRLNLIHLHILMESSKDLPVRLPHRRSPFLPRAYDHPACVVPHMVPLPPFDRSDPASPLRLPTAHSFRHCRPPSTPPSSA